VALEAVGGEEARACGGSAALASASGGCGSVVVGGDPRLVLRSGTEEFYLSTQSPRGFQVPRNLGGSHLPVRRLSECVSQAGGAHR